MYCPHCRQSRLFDDPQNPNRSQVSDDTHQYRQQYINSHNTELNSQPTKSHLGKGFHPLNESFVRESSSPFGSSSFSATTTSFTSPVTMNLVPVEKISHAVTSLSLYQHDSILLQEYSRQIHPK